jgi:type II secretory pathway pseudopilin PulG
MARKMKRFAEGGDTYYTARRARKEADIESDYQKALKAGKNAQIALAKKEQRMADAADDFAKWTRADRSQTRAAESAAESALKEARRTQGRSIADRDLGSRINPTPSEPIKTPKIEASDLSGYFKAPTSRKPAAPARRTPAPQPAARREEAPRSRGTWYDRPTTAPNKVQQDYDRGAAMRKALTPDSERVTPAMIAAVRRFAGPDAPAYNAFGDRPSSEQLRKQAEAKTRAATLWREAGEKVAQEKRKGGTVKKKPVKKSCGGGMTRYAKGGSIDGCAVRGKTRAKRTK